MINPIYKNKLVKLYQGDCLEIMPQLNIAFDACITDPPYGCLNKSNQSSKWDSVIDLNKMWKCLSNITNKNTPIILFGSGIFSAQLILSNSCQYKYSLIWNKQKTTGFLNANKMPLRCHEDILIFYEKLPTYNPQMKKCLPHQKNHSRGHGKNITNRCYGEFKNI